MNKKYIIRKNGQVFEVNFHNGIADTRPIIDRVKNADEKQILCNSGRRY